MSPATFRLVLLVSCTHALVHVFELAFPAVEQVIGEAFHVSAEITGRLGAVWRLPFGLGAMLAGWLADRYGSKRMLVIYLVGCGAMSLVVSQTYQLYVLFAAMALMGSFASIYHPAGLAVISRETTPETRGSALGWHGIFGSLGIAGSPFLAGLLLRADSSSWWPSFLPTVGWRDYYLLLAGLGAVFAVAVAARLRETPRHSAAEGPFAHPEDFYHARPFMILVAAGVLQGIVYGALMQFLPRYLGRTQLATLAENPASMRALLAGVVLLWGVVGQWIAGRWCRPGRLEKLLTLVLLVNAPCLVWMALAEGETRLVAACATAVVHFAHQPVYNSLIAQYVPRARRSLGYGFSNMMCFGLGALGPLIAGILLDWRGEEAGFAWVYGSMATLSLSATALSVLLLGRGQPSR